MSGRKRPHPDNVGTSSTYSSSSITKKNCVLISGTVSTRTASVGATWTVGSIVRCDSTNVYSDSITNTQESTPVPCSSSVSHGDPLEVTSSIESTWTTSAFISTTDASESRNESGEIEICFGMLVDGLLSAWRRLPTSKDVGSRPEALALTPRFRDNGISIIDPKIQEIGVLDNETANGLVSLKQNVSSVRFEIYPTKWVQRGTTPDKGLGIPLEILVFGPESSLGQVGSLLSASNLFLQEPINRQLSVLYKNPHVFSWDEDDDDTQSSYLLEPSDGGQTELLEKIQSVLDNDNSHVHRLSFQVEQDARITSTLKQHQLIALKYMIAREALTETDRLTLWKPVERNGRLVFKNEVSHSTKMWEPTECRGGILADEMGMGKSLSLLALILYTLPSQTPAKIGNEYYHSIENTGIRLRATLIIAPKSTIQGWEQQIKKHTQPEALKVYIYHGNKRKICHKKLSQYDIVLTTYETAASDASSSGIISSITWLRIVLDEAHHIRNRSTRNFQELMKLRAERRWCLTGTPVQNKLSDLFSLTQFLRFEPLESHTNARKYVLEPLSRKDPQGLENLRLALQVISLRRTNKSCSTLRRIEVFEQVVFNETEKCYYFATRDEARKSLILATGKSQGQILLRAISNLRHICSYGGAIIGASSNYQAVQDHDTCDNCACQIETHEASPYYFYGTCGHKMCYECTLDQNSAEETFSSRSPSICLICQEPAISILENKRQRDASKLNTTLMDWQPTEALSQNYFSSKIAKLIVNLQKLEQATLANTIEPVKSLIFSHWTRTLDCLEKALSFHGIKYGRIDGSLTVEQRRTVIHQFNTDPHIRVLLLSYGSGSVGLNLEVASHVHLMEPNWNPMVEAQAAARIDRLDQTKDIYIHRYIVKDSIEENIQRKQRGKLRDAELSASRMSRGAESNTYSELMELSDLL